MISVDGEKEWLNTMLAMSTDAYCNGNPMVVSTQFHDKLTRLIDKYGEPRWYKKWKKDVMPRVELHLKAIREDNDKFLQQINDLLRVKISES